MSGHKKSKKESDQVRQEHHNRTYRYDMQGEKEIDPLELQLHRLVPEHLHPEDRPERPKEREKQKFLFRRPPLSFRGLPFVEGEGKEGDYIEEDVDCKKDEDVLHLDNFG